MFMIYEFLGWSAPRAFNFLIFYRFLDTIKMLQQQQLFFITTTTTIICGPVLDTF